MAEQREVMGQIEPQIGEFEIVVPTDVCSSPWVGLLASAWVGGGFIVVTGNASRRAVDRAAVIPLGCPGTLHHFAGSGHEPPPPQSYQMNNLINTELRQHANLTPSACLILQM